MRLRSIVNAVTRSVNPNMQVSVLLSTGFTIGAGAKQIPAYAPAVAADAQIQALDGDDLKQLDGLNIQGTLRAIYVYGPIMGTIRPNQTGGDLIKITDMVGFPGERTWLVTKVLESWPEWTKAVIVLQMSGA